MLPWPRPRAPQAKAWGPAVEEQKEIIKRHGPELTFEALSEMEVLHRNITEALRIHPPLILLMRYCKAPFSVTTRDGKSYVVPKVRVGAGGCGTRALLQLYAGKAAAAHVCAGKHAGALPAPRIWFGVPPHPPLLSFPPP